MLPEGARPHRGPALRLRAGLTTAASASLWAVSVPPGCCEGSQGDQGNVGWACERQPLTVVTVMCSRCHSRKGGSDAGQRAHPLADQHGGPCPLPGRAPGRPTPPGTAGAGPAARSARTEVGGARKRRAGLRQGSRCRAQRTPRHAVGLTPAERKLAARLRAGAASTGPLTEAAGGWPGGRAGAGRGCRRRPFGPGPCAAPRKTRSSSQTESAGAGESRFRKRYS